MNWQAIGSFVVALAPFVVALAGIIGSWVRGSDALKAKDQVIAALQVQLDMMERLRPARLKEDLDALHAYYTGQITTLKTQVADAEQTAEQLSAAERQKVEVQKTLLGARLERAEAARILTGLLQDVMPEVPGTYQSLTFAASPGTPPRNYNISALRKLLRDWTELKESGAAD